jgi:hypothetical protein
VYSRSPPPAIQHGVLFILSLYKKLSSSFSPSPYNKLARKMLKEGDLQVKNTLLLTNGLVWCPGQNKSIAPPFSSMDVVKGD